MINLLFRKDDSNRILRAITYAVNSAFSDMTQNEPQLVANLVCLLPRYINRIAQSNNIRISVNGAFVHALPLVICKTFPDKIPGSVEIGDLLLLQTMVSNDRITKQNALLLQAKKGNKYSKADNKNQWHLYSNWPPFIYGRRSGYLMGEQRYICEPDMYDAAKYLFINGAGCAEQYELEKVELRHQIRCDNCGLLTAQPTTPKLSRHQCFIHELFNFIQGNAGKPYDTSRLGKGGWDQVVNDLISATKDRVSVFTDRASASFDAMTFQKSGVFLAGASSKHSLLKECYDMQSSHNFSDHNSNDGPPNFDGGWPEEPDYPEDSGGVSIVEFIVNAEE
ncbi:hypothetical protein [Maridesulfovibrio sp.]|uniref:hypothetical protein n=1 Tax=Maridesulfovibrio sp. TaxID=2795000 RepID=UPI002A188609|nr:hypothetical protein [Maridesulfovibrio sp.]